MAMLRCGWAVSEPLTTLDDATASLTLRQAAMRHGAYCWVEQRLFELAGAWSAGPGLPPSLRVHLFEASAQHAAHAARWYDRLPVLATMDRGELARPVGPALGPLIAHLGRGAPGADGSGAGEAGAGGVVDAEAGLRFVAGLYRVVLPRLLESYRRHALRLSPVADEPSRRTVEAVIRAEEVELAEASLLLDGDTGVAAASLGSAVRELEMLLQGAVEAPDEDPEAGIGDAGDGLVPWSDARCAW